MIGKASADGVTRFWTRSSAVLCTVLSVGLLSGLAAQPAGASPGSSGLGAGRAHSRQRYWCHVGSGVVVQQDVAEAVAGLCHAVGADLAYAPPFSTVWDPLLIAAQQLARQI